MNLRDYSNDELIALVENAYRILEERHNTTVDAEIAFEKIFVDGYKAAIKLVESKKVEVKYPKVQSILDNILKQLDHSLCHAQAKLSVPENSRWRHPNSGPWAG